MKSSENLFNTDATRWQRVYMVGRYFSPALRVKSLCFIGLAFANIVAASFFGTSGEFLMAAILISLVSFMIILTPVFFATHTADEVYCSLPALPAEKQTFVFLYAFVLMPLAIVVPGAIYLEIFYPGLEEKILGTTYLMMISPSRNLFIINMLLSTATQIAVGLWAAFASRGRGRSARTVLAILAAEAINGLIGFIVGFFAAISSYKEIKVSPVVDIYEDIVPYTNIFWGILLIFALYKASRAITRKQV